MVHEHQIFRALSFLDEKIYEYPFRLMMKRRALLAIFVHLLECYAHDNDVHKIIPLVTFFDNVTI